jgi:hypothetical protein
MTRRPVSSSPARPLGRSAPPGGATPRGPPSGAGVPVVGHGLAVWLPFRVKVSLMPVLPLTPGPPRSAPRSPSSQRETKLSRCAAVQSPRAVPAGPSGQDPQQGAPAIRSTRAGCPAPPGPAAGGRRPPPPAWGCPAPGRRRRRWAVWFRNPAPGGDQHRRQPRSRRQVRHQVPPVVQVATASPPRPHPPPGIPDCPPPGQFLVHAPPFHGASLQPRRQVGG